MLDPAEISKRKQKRYDWQKLWNEEYKDDFCKFLWLTWLHLGHGAPTPIQYDIAYFLQHGPQRTCIEALRGIGKSYITCTPISLCKT